jgi:hypothetical protein
MAACIQLIVHSFYIIIVRLRVFSSTFSCITIMVAASVSWPELGDRAKHFHLLRTPPRITGSHKPMALTSTSTSKIYHNFLRNMSSCEDEPMGKRRKVRKGTQSCWQCKRRKVRCIFALPTNTACDNCTRRKNVCVSQEYVDETEAPRRRDVNGVEARLSRVEDMLHQLVGSHNSNLSEGPSEPTTRRNCEGSPPTQDSTVSVVHIFLFGCLI